MPEKKPNLIVGLGNPGNDYKDTRHNAGFMVIDSLGEKFSIAVVKKKFNILFGRGFINNEEVVLAKPQTFMNLSGPAISRFMNYFKIPYKDLIVVHDDLDFVFGRLKIKEKGGDGGHKGIRSLNDALGKGDYTRLRVGIGRSGTNINVVNHVLGKFTSEEKDTLPLIISEARKAVITILCNGAKKGMNKYNQKTILINS